jgi:hypothetical protein
LDEGWLADEVTAEEHAVADLVSIEMLREFGAGEWCLRPDGEFEPEP